MITGHHSAVGIIHHIHGEHEGGHLDEDRGRGVRIQASLPQALKGGQKQGVSSSVGNKNELGERPLHININ